MLEFTVCQEQQGTPGCGWDISTLRELCSGFRDVSGTSPGRAESQEGWAAMDRDVRHSSASAGEAQNGNAVQAGALW